MCPRRWIVFQAKRSNSLKIELKYGTLDIEESDTDEVTVKVEKDQEKCKATVNDRVLKIEDTREKGTKDIITMCCY